MPSLDLLAQDGSQNIGIIVGPGLHVAIRFKLVPTAAGLKVSEVLRTPRQRNHFGIRLVVG